MDVHVWGILVEEDDMAIEDKSDYFLKFKNRSQAVGKEAAEGVELIKVLIDNLVARDCKIMVSLQHIQEIRDAQVAHIFGRLAVVLVDFLYYFLSDHGEFSHK